MGVRGRSFFPMSLRTFMQTCFTYFQLFELRLQKPQIIYCDFIRLTTRETTMEKTPSYLNSTYITFSKLSKQVHCEVIWKKLHRVQSKGNITRFFLKCTVHGVDRTSSETLGGPVLRAFSFYPRNVLILSYSIQLFYIYYKFG